MGSRLLRWGDERLNLTPVARTTTRKAFPRHWSFLIGEIALYSFLFLVLTGVYLTLFFDPSMAPATYEGSYGPMDGATVPAAYASVLQLSFDVRAGLLVRQAHHWAAVVFVAAITVHLARIFLTGAYRRPHEVNWLIGVTLLVLAVVNGYAGYSLPLDLLAGTALRFLHATLMSIPVVGPWASLLVFGGEFPGDQITGRLFVLHVLVVPVLLGGLIALHMAVLVRQKHTQFPGPGRTERNVVGEPFWPRYLVRTVSLLCAVFSVLLLLGGLVQINPVWLRAPFAVSTAPSPAQPDWYLMWTDGALRLYPPWEPSVFGWVLPNVFVPVVVLVSVTLLLLYVWPFLDARITGDRGSHQLLQRPRERPGRVAVSAFALGFYGVLTVASSDDVIAALLGVDVEDVVLVLRVALLVVPPLLAGLAFVLARALLLSGARGVLSLGVSDLRAAVRRRPADAQEQHA
jgi:ubiquinol-cytochrome c reductase cytochrome b subunit